MKVLEAFKLYQRVVKELIENITAKPTKWFVDFLLKLFDAVVAIPDKINFSSLSRCSGMTDRTFRNWFKRKDCDWLEFNRKAMSRAFGDDRKIVLAFDPAHITKNGESTYGIGRYWSGAEKRTKAGLEIMDFGAISVIRGKCIMLEAVQTPPVEELHNKKTMTMLEWYLWLVTSQKERLLGISNILTADAFFSRKPFIDGVIEAAFNSTHRKPI